MWIFIRGVGLAVTSDLMKFARYTGELILVLLQGCRHDRDVESIESYDSRLIDPSYVSEYLIFNESANSLFAPLGACLSDTLRLEYGDESVTLFLFRLSNNRYRYFSGNDEISIDVEHHGSLGSVVREFAALKVLRNGPGIPKMIELRQPRCWNILTKAFEVSWRLSDLLQVQSTLNETMVATIGYKAIRVLRFTHNRGILHNGISSSTILVSRSLDVQLIQWGHSSLFVDRVDSPPRSRKDDFLALLGTLFFAQTGKDITEPLSWEDINPYSPFHNIYLATKNLTYSDRPPYEMTMSDFQWYVNILSGVDIRHTARGGGLSA